MKRCSKCKKEVPLSGFSKSRVAEDGLQPKCKVCQREEQKQRREQGKIKPYKRTKKKDTNITPKTCTKCGVEKPSNQFHKSKDTKDGYKSWCKECVKENNSKCYTKKDTSSTKQCSCCKDILPLNNIYFDARSASPDGFQTICKICRYIKYSLKPNRIKLVTQTTEEKEEIAKKIRDKYKKDEASRYKTLKHIIKQCRRCSKFVLEDKIKSAMCLDCYFNSRTEILHQNYQTYIRNYYDDHGRKLCKVCMEYKRLENFRKNKDKRDFLDVVCTECARKKEHAYGSKEITTNDIDYNRIIKYHEFKVINESPHTSCFYCNKLFVPTKLQVHNRLNSINKVGFGENNLYCSDSCKENCPSFNQELYPKGFEKASSREVTTILRKIVLERDNWICQKCEISKEYNPNISLHVHHIKSYTQNKIFGNDPDNCVVLCSDCHKEVHSIDGCRYIDLRCKYRKILTNTFRPYTEVMSQIKIC